VSPAAGPLRGAKGKGELEEKLAPARGVMSELCAGYRETLLLVETCVVRKADGIFCEASIGKQKGSAGDVSSTCRCAGGTANFLGGRGSRLGGMETLLCQPSNNQTATVRVLLKCLRYL
jgi:hypothetical protein